MQNMRDMLRTTLGRSLEKLSPLDRLAAAWPVAAGAALAARAEVIALDEDGIVHLTVTGEQWMQPLLQMRSVLEHELARIARVELHGIHFEVKRAKTVDKSDDRRQ